MQKDEELQKINYAYDKGLYTEVDYWRDRKDLDERYDNVAFVDKSSSKRSTLCKVMGLLAHYLDDFYLDYTYIRYLNGENIADAISACQARQQRAEQLKKETEKNRRFSELLSSLKEVPTIAKRSKK